MIKYAPKALAVLGRTQLIRYHSAAALHAALLSAGLSVLWRVWPLLASSNLQAVLLPLPMEPPTTLGDSNLTGEKLLRHYKRPTEAFARHAQQSWKLQRTQ